MTLPLRGGARCREFVVAVLPGAGYDTKAFAGSMALKAREAARRIELLITRAKLPQGTRSTMTKVTLRLYLPNAR